MPLGYDVQDRKLVINEAEAASVRRIFERFVELGSATMLAKELRREGFRSKQGTLIDKGYLYRVLRNRVYRGEAVHKGKAYPGEHEAIVTDKVWDQVDAILQGRHATELVFKGKEFVWNHHLAVPASPLVPQPDKGIGEVRLDGNLIVQGDNLHALKALLPMYACLLYTSRCV